MSELLVYPGQALKVVDPGEGDDALIAEGYGLVFTKGRPDLSAAKDYFTTSTDYGVLSDAGTVTLPSFFDHGTTKALGTERLGVVEVKMDEVGLFTRHIIKRRKEYIRKVMEALKDEDLEMGQSTGAIPRDVRRKSVGNGVHEITHWPLWEVSLTPEPAEPLTYATVKAIATGLGLPDASADWNAPDWDSALLALKSAREEVAITRAIRTARLAHC